MTSDRLSSRSSLTGEAFGEADRPLRVLWVTTSASSDGPGRTLAALLRHWPDQDAVLVCALRGITPAFRDAIPGRIETVPLGMRGLLDVTAIAALSRLCHTWRPDILHTQLSRADWIGRVVGAFSRRPVVSTIQNVHSRMYDAEFSWPMARLGRLLDRLTSPLASRLIAVSSGVREDLARSGVGTDRITIIHNGLDPLRLPIPARRAEIRAAWHCGDDDVVVGTVALLKAQKGIHDLVEAARIATSRNPQIRFVQMGDGPLEHDIRRWVVAAGLGDRFRMLDRVEDPMALLAGVDIFALPSLWEGLPIALLEAMAAGLPAVGTHVSGIEEVIVAGETGVLVPPAAPGQLAEALLDLAASPDRRRAFGTAARARLARFDARPLAEANRRVYLETLRSRPAVAVPSESYS